MKIEMTKQNALQRLIAAGFCAEITNDGLDVSSRDWSAHYDDQGQAWNTYTGKIPPLVEELAVWDDADTRKEAE